MFYPSEQDKINQIIINGARMSKVNLEDIIKIKVSEWMASEKRKTMLLGEQYYRNRTDIQNKKVQNDKHSNVKLEHGFIRKLVDQKTGYLLSKPFSIKTENKTYAALLNELFDKVFLRLLKNVGKESVNKGLAWMYVYINAEGRLAFKKIPSHEVIPFWADIDHTELDAVVRVYEIDVYESRDKKTETKVVYYGKDGIQCYLYKNGELLKDVEAGIESSYFTLSAEGESKAYNWTEIPFIAFKYNEEEQALLEIVKSLVDDYNSQVSTNADILADIPLFIYILKNYGGADLHEFITDLKENRAIKVMDDGGVDKLTAEPVTAALQAHLESERKAIYEFGRGVDSLSDKIGTASGVALKFRYADLDMDGNSIDTEFQASFARLLWFVNQYFLMTGQGDFTGEQVSIIFNRDIIISESDVIKDCQASKGIISDRTIITNHPYVEDVEDEIKQMEKEAAAVEQKQEAAQYPGLGNNTGGDAGGES